MILLKLQLAIQADQPKSAIAASPFLGGVLHGTFERLVIKHAPIICNELGIKPSGQWKQYAVLPPPFGWQPSTPSSTITMQCGIMLYGQAKQYTQVIIALLEKWNEIRLANRTDKIQCQHISFQIPGSNTPSWHDSSQLTQFRGQPDFTQNYSPRDGITINLFTPLKLGKFHSISGRPQPPRLLQIVRSITQRIKKLEPELANALGLSSLSWIEAEEKVRPIAVDWHQLESVYWKYGSSTKQHTIPFSGLLGQIHYSGPIPETIITLLHWGEWFGIGESTALGQGMYYIDNPLIKYKSPK